jgi:hypothetical protein
VNSIEESLTRLSSAAQQLNQVRDKMSASILDLDKKLHSLQIGVTGWVMLASSASEARELGYAKVGGKWGLALRVTEVQPYLVKECWHFNDAPTWFRVEAVTRIPDLLEHLVKRSADTLALVEKRVVEVEEILGAIAEVSK